MPRLQAPVGDLHISNLLTYLSLTGGMAAIAAAIAFENVPLAGVAIAVSAVADTFDGRYANSFRRTPRQARIGHELDSLADTVAFGVAPAVVISAALEGPAAIAAWMAATAYVLAAIVRLAYYNVQDEGGGFVGMPTPAAALLCVTGLLIPAPPTLAAWPLAAGSVLMVAPIPVRRPRAAGLALFAAWALGLAAAMAVRAASASAP